MPRKWMSEIEAIVTHCRGHERISSTTRHFVTTKKRLLNWKISQLNILASLNRETIILELKNLFSKVFWHLRGLRLSSDFTLVARVRSSHYPLSCSIFQSIFKSLKQRLKTIVYFSSWITQKNQPQENERESRTKTNIYRGVSKIDDSSFLTSHRQYIKLSFLFKQSWTHKKKCDRWELRSSESLWNIWNDSLDS
jgi:hypothetical protein